MSWKIPSKTCFSERVILGLLFLLVGSAVSFAFCERKDSEGSCPAVLGVGVLWFRRDLLELEKHRMMVRVW
jgi:hypothetical protein